MRFIRGDYVHNFGRVTGKYLRECSKADVKVPDECKIGQVLYADGPYFRKSRATIREFGVKLAYWFWIAIEPDQLHEATDLLLDYILDLIRDGDYKDAISMAQFPSELKVPLNDTERIILALNHAQCHKWLDDQSACNETLGTVDWGPLEDKFLLARAVLLDKWEDAISIMKKVGLSGSVPEVAYHDWPIFREFIKKKDFDETYRAIFGKEFALVFESSGTHEPDDS